MQKQVFILFSLVILSVNPSPANAGGGLLGIVEGVWDCTDYREVLGGDCFITKPVLGRDNAPKKQKKSYSKVELTYMKQQAARYKQNKIEKPKRLFNNPGRR